MWGYLSGSPLQTTASRSCCRTPTPASVETVNSGRMPFREEGASELLPKVLASGKLTATTDGGALSTAATVVVVIGTPVDRFLNPDIGAVLRAVDEVARHLVDGQLLVLRSTVYPGVTAMVEKRLAEKGMDVDVVFCPERIAEGHALEELSSLPQIVSGRQTRAIERAAKLFRSSLRRSSSSFLRRRSWPSSSPTPGGTSSLRPPISSS